MTADRLIMHLGLHKTGTTAVQLYLEANSAELLQRGATYVPLDRMREEVTPLFYDTDDQKRQAVRRLLEVSATRSVIWSDENIAGGVDDIVAGEFYPAARTKVTAVLEALTDLDVHLVLTLRDPTELIPSLYSEYLRQRDFITFETYVANLDLSSISYWDTFGWMRSLPDNVATHIVSYERRYGGGVAKVADAIVLAAIGTVDGLDSRTLYETRVRASFTAEEIELAELAANRSNGKVAHLLLSAIDENDIRFGERRHTPLDGALAASLSKRYEEDLARFGVASGLAG